MHYRLGTISLAATTLLLSLPSLLLPLNGFESLAVQTQTTQDRQAEAQLLIQQGSQHFGEKNYQAAIESYQKALAIYRAMGERTEEATVLIKLGEAYYGLRFFSYR